MWMIRPLPGGGFYRQLQSIEQVAGIAAGRSESGADAHLRPGDIFRCHNRARGHGAPDPG